MLRGKYYEVKEMISRKTTRELLGESLHELAENKPVDKITVREIVENCGMSSATFYRYFHDKYELIAWIYNYQMEDIFLDFCEGTETCRACSSHHAAILCEGSTLKSTFANALTLFMCEAAGIMANQGKPCLAYGSEVGYMEPFLEKAAVRLCRNTYFITRTQGSLAVLKKLGLHGHAGTDAAWSYDQAIDAGEADQMLMKQGWDGKKPLLGIAVINPFCWPVRASLRKWLKGLCTKDLSGQYDKWYFFSDSPVRREAYQQYIREIAHAAGSFIQEHDYFPVVIRMERLDEKACRALRERLPCPGATFLSGDCPADMMTSVLHRLSFLVTSRYHAAVLSMEKGCPIVAVSMDERLDGIMRELSLDQKYLLHVTDKALGKKLYSALADARSNQDAIHRRVQSHSAEYRDRLADMGTFLKRYILTPN